MKKSFRSAVFAVVYKKENSKILYLLLKRKLHWKGWEFPKGGIEKGESEITAVKREVKEETSLKVLKINKYAFKGKYSYSSQAKKDRPGYAGQSYLLYSAEVKSEKVKFDKREHSGFKWLEYQEALKSLSWPNQKRCLKIVNKKISLQN